MSMLDSAASTRQRGAKRPTPVTNPRTKRPRWFGEWVPATSFASSSTSTVPAEVEVIEEGLAPLPWCLVGSCTSRCEWCGYFFCSVAHDAGTYSGADHHYCSIDCWDALSVSLSIDEAEASAAVLEADTPGEASDAASLMQTGRPLFPKFACTVTPAGCSESVQQVGQDDKIFKENAEAENVFLGENTPDSENAPDSNFVELFGRSLVDDDRMNEILRFARFFSSSPSQLNLGSKQLRIARQPVCSSSNSWPPIPNLVNLTNKEHYNKGKGKAKGAGKPTKGL